MSKKPIVALLFSSGSDSSESQYLATYLGCHLFWGGYSSIRLVPIKGKHQKSSDDTPTSSVLCVPQSNAGKVTKVEAGADFWMRADLKSTLKECHVVIICVCTSDTKRCVKDLRQYLPKKEDMPIAIISFQYGPWTKNYKVIEEEYVTSIN